MNHEPFVINFSCTQNSRRDARRCCPFWKPFYASWGRHSIGRFGRPLRNRVQAMKGKRLTMNENGDVVILNLSPRSGI